MGEEGNGGGGGGKEVADRKGMRKKGGRRTHLMQYR